MANKKSKSLTTPISIKPEICAFYLADSTVIVSYFFGIFDKDKLILSQPYLMVDNPEDDSGQTFKLIKWIPMINDEIIHIRESFVISVLEPEIDLLNMYIEATSKNNLLNLNITIINQINLNQILNLIYH